MSQIDWLADHSPEAVPANEHNEHRTCCRGTDYRCRFPQVIRAYRTRQTRDISIWQPVLLTVGMTLWLIYGVLLGDIPLIVANAISILCYSALIFMKLRYKEIIEPSDRIVETIPIEFGGIMKRNAPVCAGSVSLFVPYRLWL